MSTRLSTFIFLLICALVLVARSDAAQSAATPSKASGFEFISAVAIRSEPQGIAIEITASAPFIPQGLQLAGPDRLVFDFPGYELRTSNRRLAVNNGPVQQVRLSLFSVQPPVTRIVVDLSQPLNFEIIPTGNKIVIELAFENTASARTAPRISNPAAPAAKTGIASSSGAASTSSIATEKNHYAPSGAEANPHSNGIPPAGATSRVSAYSLQAKAKTLKLDELQALEDKAKTGDPEAETTLALAYHDAVLLKKDDDRALMLLHKAADRNFMAAEESLGIFYETGAGVPRADPDEALLWFRKAVQQGSLDAMTNIGLIYADGVGVSKDPAQALTWFRQAADAGEGAAQYNLALMYARGEGTARDYKESVRWLSTAAEKSVVPAIMDLAAFYLRPLDDSAPDIERAVHYYEKASELGNDRAAAILGNIYATGKEGKPDYDQAVKWYKKAADMGQRDGEYGLGIRYAFGQGVHADLPEARRLFTASADQGLAPAQYNLATMCEEGNGGPVDRDCARRNYQLAADQGMAKAQFRLGKMLASDGNEKLSAYKWLMLAQSSVKESSPVLNELRKSMSSEEISQAEGQVDSWRIAHPETRQ